MGLLDTLFGWIVVGAVLSILIGAGVGVMSTSPPEFMAAKIFFTIAAALIFLRMGLWLASEHSSITMRLIMAFLLFGTTGVLWTGSWRWISVRQEQWQDTAIIRGATPVVVVSESERHLQQTLGAFIPRGESIRNQFREEFARLVDGHVNLQLVDVRRRQIEIWREELGAVLEGQEILRPEVSHHIMTESGDRISESINRLREILNNWHNWRR